MPANNPGRVESASKGDRLLLRGDRLMDPREDNPLLAGTVQIVKSYRGLLTLEDLHQTYFCPVIEPDEWDNVGGNCHTILAITAAPHHRLVVISFPDGGYEVTFVR